MLFSDFLQIIAVLLEIAVMGIAGLIAIRHRKSYGWCIAATFGLFVIFDIGRLFSLPIPVEAHALIFLVASGSMLFGVWLIYKDLTIFVRPKV